MRVLACMLTAGGLSGGSEKTLAHLLPQMAVHKDIEQMLVLVNSGTDVTRVASKLDIQTYGKGYGLLDIASIPRTIRGWKPDVVFIPNLLYVKTGLPTVVMMRNTMPLLNPIEKSSILGTIYNYARRSFQARAARKSTRIICVSRFAQKLTSDTWNIPASKIDIVYHGVEQQTDIPVSTYPIHHPIQLVCLGSLVKYRGLEDAIEAVSILQKRGIETELHIIGDGGKNGAYLQGLKHLTKTLNVENVVFWYGRLSHKDAMARLNEADFFVMTSRMEACPNTALESMAHGSLIVSTDNPPMPEMFENCALYYRAGDSEQLALTICEMCKLDIVRLTERRKLSRKRGKNFTWQRAADQTVLSLRTAIQSVRMSKA